MKIKLNSKNIYFIIYFQFYLVYQMLIANGLLPPFLKGYLGIVSILLFIPASFTFFDLKKYKLNKFLLTDKIIIVFLLYMLFIISFNFGLGANEIIVSQYMAVIPEYFIVYIIFRQLNFNNKLFFRLSFLIVFISIFFIFDYAILFTLGGNGVATYQGIAQAYILILIALLSKSKLFISRLFLYIIGTITLFFIGARSEFGLFVFLILINELYFSKKKLLFVSIFLGIVMLIFINSNSIISLLTELAPDSRVIPLLASVLFGDIGSNKSVGDRAKILHDGLNTIDNSPILGNFANYHPGHHIHNILASWADFGILGISFIVVFVFVPVVYAIYKIFIKRENNSYIQIVFLLSILTSILLIFAKTFVYLGVPATWGAFANYLKRKKYEHRYAVRFLQ